MVPSAKLLEREGTSTVLDYTISLVCAKHRSGKFSLTLIESSDVADIRHTVAKRIRSAKAFIDAVMSIRDWTELDIDYDVIIDEICVPLRKLDAAFADSIIDQIVTDRGGTRMHRKQLRARRPGPRRPTVHTHRPWSLPTGGISVVSVLMR